MGFTDTGLAPGSTHTYKIRVKDSDGNVQWSIASAPVTVSATAPSAYTPGVRADGASHLWQLGDTGPGFIDSVGFADGTSGEVTFGMAGAMADNAAMSSPAGPTPKAYTTSAEAHPAAVTVEAWVKTTSSSGGRMVGFGDSSSGTSATLERHGPLPRQLGKGRLRPQQRRVALGDVDQGRQRRAVAPPRGHRGRLRRQPLRRRPAGRPRPGTRVDEHLLRLLADPRRPDQWPAEQADQRGSVGSVDEVAVYPTALTQGRSRRTTRVRSAPPTGVPTPTDTYGAAVTADAPDLYWRLNETSGTTASDASTSGQNGAVAGAVTWGPRGGGGQHRRDLQRHERRRRGLPDGELAVDLLGRAVVHVDLDHRRASSSASATRPAATARVRPPGRAAEQRPPAVRREPGHPRTSPRRRPPTTTGSGTTSSPRRARTA